MGKIIVKGVVTRKSGYLYYVDGKGNVCEAKMSRGGKKKKAKKKPVKKVAKKTAKKKIKKKINKMRGNTIIQILIIFGIVLLSFMLIINLIK